MSKMWSILALTPADNAKDTVMSDVVVLSPMHTHTHTHVHKAHTDTHTQIHKLSEICTSVFLSMVRHCGGSCAVNAFASMHRPLFAHPP